MKFTKRTNQQAQIKPFATSAVNFMGAFILFISCLCIFSVMDGEFPLVPWAAISTLGFCCTFANYKIKIDKETKNITIRAKSIYVIKSDSIAFADIRGIVVNEKLFGKRDYRLYLKLVNEDRYILINKGYKNSLEKVANELSSFINKPIYKTYER